LQCNLSRPTEFPPRQTSRTLRQISSSFKWQNFKALHKQVYGNEGLGMEMVIRGLGFGHYQHPQPSLVKHTSLPFIFPIFIYLTLAHFLFLAIVFWKHFIYLVPYRPLFRECAYKYPTKRPLPLSSPTQLSIIPSLDFSFHKAEPQ